MISHEDFFFSHEYIKKLLLSLTPFYISLQSFWGITIAEATENKVTFAQLGNNKNAPQYADAIRQKMELTNDTIDEQY